MKKEKKEKQKMSGKRKLANTAYILLTLTLVVLYIIPLTSIDVSGIGNYFGSLGLSGSTTKLAYQLDTLNKACQITGIGKYSETELVIPSDVAGNRVTSIGDSAFSYSAGFTSLKVPSSVTIVGNYAFACCNDLEKVEIAKGTEHIGIAVFMSCQNLKTVILPAGIKSIGDYTFHDCPKLSSIYFGGTKAQWEKISATTYWNQNTERVCTVYCSDGAVK